MQNRRNQPPGYAKPSFSAIADAKAEKPAKKKRCTSARGRLMRSFVIERGSALFDEAL
ncbi:hypothetical protein [Adlercreutzia aquisgranensis]|uniref:hypothetical protein n=1 Tax=Adlercreutzia aquisgranensis TaxID=2941323 RepID=UPI00203C3302|nr:hypothetical protein [Adlercreutzia aquisgranensis]